MLRPSAETMPAYVDALSRFRPRLIDSYPSNLELLARYILQHGITSVRPHSVITSSETLLPAVRSAIEDAFGCRVFDHYGSAEMAAFIGDDSIRLQESYPCSEGFIAFGDRESDLLRLVFDHGIFYEFVPLEELGSERPTRHWLGNAEFAQYNVADALRPLQILYSVLERALYG